MSKNCDEPVAAATAYSSPPCYAHEFPGWFGECDAPAEPEAAPAKPAQTREAADPEGSAADCPPGAAPAADKS
jgi:hypothetical protein